MEADLELRVTNQVEDVCVKKVKNQDSLIKSGLMDSMGVVDLVVALEEEFDIEIDSNALDDEQFETVASIVLLVKRCVESNGR
jgi:acyl carrier protein